MEHSLKIFVKQSGSYAKEKNIKTSGRQTPDFGTF